MVLLSDKDKLSDMLVAVSKLTSDSKANGQRIVRMPYGHAVMWKGTH